MESEQSTYNNTLDKTLPGKAVLVSRALLYTLVGLILSAILWSAFTRVDVVVNARGQLVVEGEPIKISAPEAGIVIEAPVKPGDHVAQGQLILQLDPYHYDGLERDLVVELDAAVAGGDLVKSRAVQEQLTQLRDSRKRLSLTAPVAGTITRVVTLRPGVNVAIDQPAAVLMPDKLPLVAEVHIPNSSMRGLQTGKSVRVTLDAFPREDFGEIEGKLLRIDPDSTDDGTYKGTIALNRLELRGPTGPETLRPGLQLDARIVVERSSLLKLLLNPLRKLSQPVTVGQ